MSIIDRRSTNKNKSVTNRQKFIKRYKKKIKDAIDDLTTDKGITDVLKDRKVRVHEDTLEEPEFTFDYSRGKRDLVLPGNKKYSKGDAIPNDRDESEGEGFEGSDSDDELFDEFIFTLTKDEFLDLYFSDLELPNFIKEQLNQTIKYKWKRAGFIKEGIPARLDLLKTLKQSLARRIATGSDRYLEDIDLRYKHFTKQPLPIRHAAMICLMDVSGSMGEYEKTLAKKFFLLLYLFLHKNYEFVEILFVRHTTDAKEVTEEEFFHSNESGGTIVSSGLKLVDDIITQRYDLNDTNIYVAQASDGDNWGGDEKICADLIGSILNKVQYFAYVQTEEFDRFTRKQKLRIKDLMEQYRPLSKLFKNFKVSYIFNPKQVYKVLKDLFQKKD